jgi:hypothetical protein
VMKMLLRVKAADSWMRGVRDRVYLDKVLQIYSEGRACRTMCTRGMTVQLQCP